MKSDFLVIPAVDIMGGKCVRLVQGLPDRETVFGHDPVSVAKNWEDEGARLLHVVDLDGAFKGKPQNREIIEKIATELSIPVEVGGGIRDAQSVRSYLDSGVARIVVGTAAFKDPHWLSELASELGERLAVGVDVRQGQVAVAGWTQTGPLDPLEAVNWLALSGVKRIIYTDTSKDGTLGGANFDGIKELADSSPIPLIASGGVADLDDMVRVSGLAGSGVEGIIVGMALYRRKFTLSEAMRAVAEGSAG
jgi:phosphoribosylformimino-5-aminoimidazole carboxamide ribotide isomerase